MRKPIFVLLSLFSLSLAAQWQDKVLFSIDGDSTTAGEFAAVFNKNRDIGREIDPKTPEEYLELYINFKLKVKEASKMGIDTLGKVVNEHKAYRAQLAKPYLMDKNTDEKLVEEAYERLKHDIRASHIMIAVDENAAPSDTQAAYKKILNINEQLKKGADFAELARKHSQDDYSAKRDGDLGYFTVFDMVYPFEDAAYKTNINEVSKPVRSRYGYHLIMPTDKRPARYKIDVSHIMVVANQNSSEAEHKKAKEKIDEIYAQLRAGEKFDKLARQFSDDKNSAKEGGKLKPFGINEMVTEFEDAAFTLFKRDDYTEPVKTPYGWHIIKLNDREKVPTFEQIKKELERKVQRDSRSSVTRKAMVSKLKKEYNFNQNDRNLQAFVKKVPANLGKSDFKMEMSKPGNVLFTLNDKKYHEGDFVAYINSNSRNLRGDSKEGLVYAHLDAWIEEAVLEYEDSRLEVKYPEFKYLVREYREGILLFELMEEKIWKPSMTDTAGLENYFAAHQNDYTLPERMKVTYYEAANKKAAKKMAKAAKKGKETDVMAKLNNKNPLSVNVKSQVVRKGDNADVDAYWGQKGAFVLNKNEDDRIPVLVVEEVLQPRNKELKEAWGLVSADYQKEMELNWIEELRNTHTIEIYEDVLEAIRPNLLD